MRRVGILLFPCAIACGAPPQPAPPAPAPAPMAAPRPAPPAPAPPAEPTATPDEPSGASAARDAELAAQVGALIDLFWNQSPVLSRDGKRIVFLSNRDGLPQLYVGEAASPKAAPRRLVTSTERVASPRLTPDGKAVLYLSDTGADENMSIYRVELEGKSAPVELTPGEKLQRDPPRIADRVPGTMYFTARKASEATSALAAAPVGAAGALKVIYTNQKPAMLADVSADGKAGALIELGSLQENRLLRVDLAAGTAASIFPASGTATIFEAAFSRDGKRIYVATDGGGEQALVLALDARTGKELARHAVVPATAQFAGLVVARRGGLVGVGVLAGDHSDIRLLDGKTLAPRTTVKLPLGSGAIGEFSTDGKRLAASWSTPSSPTDVYAIDTRSGAVAPLRADPRPTLAALPRIETRVVDVPAFDGGKIPTIVYLPRGAGAVRHPVIVSFHGGPADASSIRWTVTNAFFLSLGYVIVEPNVRGSSGFGRGFEGADDGPKRLDAFRDVETTARWVATQPWADKDRLVAFGGSYGGYTVLIALSRWPELWRAGVDLFGIANLKTFMSTTSGLIRQVFTTEFGDPDKDGAFLESISPLASADKIVDPMFVYAGANDPRVPRSESDQIVRALRRRSIPSEYMVAANEGHSIWRRENRTAFFARCARFLETHLK